MTTEEMQQLTIHPGWYDGREGYLWCRLDAVLDETTGLRAELTWNDDGDEGDTLTRYIDPELYLERYVNEEILGACRPIDLTQEEAVGLAANDPKDILTLYAPTIKTILES
jgi:hypothetical protein